MFNMNHPTPNTGMNEQLDEVFDREFLVQLESYVAEDEKTRQRKKYIGGAETVKRVKQAIKANYMSWEEVEALIGPKEKQDFRDEFWEQKEARNQLREELLEKLDKRFKERSNG